MKALLCLTTALASGIMSPALAARPNIVFIYTDDQAAWTLGVTGNQDIRTPVLDRLFKEGARFPNCFATTPVCSPARAAVMTSRYGTEVGITDFLAPRRSRTSAWTRNSSPGPRS